MNCIPSLTPLELFIQFMFPEQKMIASNYWRLLTVTTVFKTAWGANPGIFHIWLRERESNHVTSWAWTRRATTAPSRNICIYQLVNIFYRLDFFAAGIEPARFGYKSNLCSFVAGTSLNLSGWFDVHHWTFLLVTQKSESNRLSYVCCSQPMFLYINLYFSSCQEIFW